MNPNSAAAPSRGHRPGRLGDADEAGELLGRGLAEEQAAQRLEDQAGRFEVVVVAEAHGVDEARRAHGRLLVADVDADAAGLPSFATGVTTTSRSAPSRRIRERQRLADVGLERLDRRRRSRLLAPLTARTTSPALRPAFSAGSPGVDPADPQVQHRPDAEVGGVVLLDQVGREAERAARRPARTQHDLDLAAGGEQHRLLVVGPGRRVVAGDARQPIADLDAGLGRRRPLEHAADLGRVALVGRLAGAVQVDADHDQERRDDVHGRTGDVDLEPLPLRLGEELVRLGRGVVVRRLAGHLHVAAERDDRDAVLGVPARELEQLGAEAEREGQDADTVPPRQEEMPELVHEHEDAEHEDEGQDVGHVVVLALERLSWRSPPAVWTQYTCGPRHRVP